jgi:shikimate kinase
MNFLIIGPSGAGKSWVISHFKKGLDLDQVLVKSSPYSSIADWVAKQGWDHFRDAEQNKLKELLSQENQLIACGAGAVNEQNYKELKKYNFKIWLLKTSFETCWERIHQDVKGRPLVVEGKDINDERYQKRMKFWESLPIDQAFSDSDELLAFLNTTKLVISSEAKA